MTGAQLQLVSYGAQDMYLTGNPQITFFKVVYRRHTNFSMESIKQIFNGTADFGQEVSVTLQRNADLVHKIYLQVKLSNLLERLKSSKKRPLLNTELNKKETLQNLYNDRRKFYEKADFIVNNNYDKFKVLEKIKSELKLYEN